jgi:hypothetical protein
MQTEFSISFRVLAALLAHLRAALSGVNPLYFKALS